MPVFYPPATVGGWQKQRVLFVAVPPTTGLKSLSDMKKKASRFLKSIFRLGCQPESPMDLQDSPFAEGESWGNASEMVLDLVDLLDNICEPPQLRERNPTVFT